MIAHQNAMSMIKIEEDWLFLLAQREKGRRRNVCEVDRALPLKEQRSRETENSGLKLCIEIHVQQHLQ